MAQRVSVSIGAPGSKKTSRVRVAVRLRPYMDQQDGKTEGPCVRGLGPQSLEIINWRNATETLRYQFDVFHGEQTTQQEVFVTSVKPILPLILSGQNASVFAYGPTGAGKTHTMLGSQEQPGIIPRAVKEVFNLVDAQKKAQDGWEYSVGMSYLEIYNEKVLDLLVPPGSQDLPIREDKDRNILIPGLTHTSLGSFADFDAHFVPASLNRTTASTKLNQRSSRSHAILQIKVVKSKHGPPHVQQTGKLYLVDLAGSEDNRRTGNQGIRLKESGAINLSLFTLSKVVDALNTGVGGRVPYRDSKLTRLLQDSLGGSAHSVMITNIAPEYRYYFDTFSALNFAAKSKQIINQPFVRETISAPVIVPGKRVRDQESKLPSEPQIKKFKEEKKAEQPSSSSSSSIQDLPDSSVLERLLALEKMLMGPAERERLDLLKTVAQSRSEIQMLKEKQKQLEDTANMFNKTNAVSGKVESKDESLFKSELLLLHRKPSTVAKPHKQQAVVTPLQVSVLQPLQQSVPTIKPSQSRKKKQLKSEICDGKENGGVDPASKDDSNWEKCLDSVFVEQSKEKILQILNTGSLKELKSLQLIGDKKAKLIMGWREINGDFVQLEELKKIEGITDKRFSSFIKANILSSAVKMTSAQK